MANRYKKRWSTLLTVREMQIETTMRCHSHQPECLIIEKSTNTINVERVWRQGNSLILFGENVNWHSHMESSMEVPEKLKLELPYDPGFSVLGTYPEKTTPQ